MKSKSVSGSGSGIKLGFVNTVNTLPSIVIVIFTFAIIGIAVSAQVPPPHNNVSVEVTPVQQTGKCGDILTYNVNLTNIGTVPDIIVVDSITGIPTGWTVELKEAGIPEILPYHTPLLQSGESYPLTLDVHIPATASTGATITVTIHSCADNSKTDSAIILANPSSLTPAPTPTPTPTAYHGDGGGGDGTLPEVTHIATPVITPTPIVTPTQEITPILTPTPTPIVTPTPTPTPSSTSKLWREIPGFDAIFAISGLLAVSYLLWKKR